MPAVKVIRDPNHPDFPHGTGKGHSRGCRCDDCCKADSVQGKLSEYRRIKNGAPTRWATPKDVAVAAQNVQALLDAIPGSSYSAIGRAAGVDTFTVTTLATGRSRSSASTAERLAALRPSDVRAQLQRVTSAHVVWRVRTLQALGYPMKWIEAKTGHDYRHVNATKVAYVNADLARPLDELAVSIGDRPASLERDGILPVAASIAKSAARRAGFYPPAFYNEDGTLDYRSIPDHPWTRVDDTAIETLDRLDFIVKHRREVENVAGSSYAIAAGYQAEDEGRDRVEKAFDRLIDRMCLRAKHNPTEERWRELEEAMRAYRFEYLDAVQVALDLDAMSVSHNYPADHPVLKDHPAWHAFLARRDAANQARREAVAPANAARAAAAKARRDAADLAMAG